MRDTITSSTLLDTLTLWLKVVYPPVTHDQGCSPVDEGRVSSNDTRPGQAPGTEGQAATTRRQDTKLEIDTGPRTKTGATEYKRQADMKI